MKKTDLVSTIEQLGFSDKESRIYLALLELGQGSLVDISRSAGLKWTITHNLVKNLVFKGLLSEIQVGNRKVYAAVHPRRLLQISQLHKQQIEQALPELVAIREQQAERPDVQLYVGIEGVRQAYDEIHELLAEGNELLWLSDLDAVGTHVPTLLKRNEQILRQKGVKRTRELLVANAAGKAYAERASQPGQKADVRFLPATLQLRDTEEALIGDKLYHFVFKKEPSVVIWQHPGVIETRRAVFNYFWNLAKG